MFSAFIWTRHCVWLCLFKDSERWETSGKWLLWQVNTSAIETITKPQSKTRGNSSDSTLKRRSDSYISVCDSNDFITAISRLHTQLGRKQLSHFWFESLFKIRWSNFMVCFWLSCHSCRKKSCFKKKLFHTGFLEDTDAFWCFVIRGLLMEDHFTTVAECFYAVSSSSSVCHSCQVCTEALQKSLPLALWGLYNTKVQNKSTLMSCPNNVVCWLPANWCETFCIRDGRTKWGHQGLFSCSCTEMSTKHLCLIHFYSLTLLCFCPWRTR